jgi:hypothetical protein
MRSIGAAELVELWERGVGRHPVDRALILLAGCSTETPEQLAALSVGRRDARLLEVYEHLFGPRLDAFAACPQCGEHLEYGLSARDLRMHPLGEDEANDLTLVVGDLSFRLRLPNSADLRTVSRCADGAAGRRLLLERCVLEAKRGGAAVVIEALPESVAEQIALRLAEADPQADLLIHLVCPSCRGSWQVVLDIESFLWVKVSALAKRLLREVHVLAQAYGWREADILALSAARRQSYLQMVRS